MAKQPTAANNAKTTQRKRTVKVEATGEAHINATFNNIIISLTNISGQVISWSSAGKMGFRGSKKNTPYAAQMAANKLAEKEDISGSSGSGVAGGLYGGAGRYAQGKGMDSDSEDECCSMCGQGLFIDKYLRCI